MRQLKGKQSPTSTTTRTSAGASEGGMESLTTDYAVGADASRAEQEELIIYSWDRESEAAELF
ncbi:hypothetical protein EJP67_28430 [Variovorax guangxiensis]|uniref:Uncharacterized protein n=1 Tax=Variovorax guangxiensis TaxID=1775474 RepID=A0A3S0ZIL3_9BURK|nr:hypothetical protein EJP67_28430 [Variovorax guangxiensis]